MTGLPAKAHGIALRRAPRRRLPLLLLLLASASVGPAAADDDTRVERGRILSETYCSRCHATGPTGSSPHDAAPPFRTFGEQWPVEALAEALAEGLVAGHPDMPEITLPPDEIDAFLAYLKALGQNGAGGG